MAERPYWGKPLGYSQIVIATATSTLVPPVGASCALMAVDTSNVRWTDDGDTPSASVGMLMRTTDVPLLYCGELSNIKMFTVTATAALNIAYYGVSV